MQNRHLMLSAWIMPLLLLAHKPSTAQYTIQDFKKLSPLSGTWIASEHNGKLYEVWEKSSEALLSGRSFSVHGNDTQQHEKVQLSWRKGAITYTPTVMDQNGGLPVDFILKSISDSGFVFENPDHDFPQRIRYYPIGNSLIASVSGHTLKGFREIVYNYKRISNASDNNAMSFFTGKWRLKAWASGKPAGKSPDIVAIWIVEPALDSTLCFSGHVQLRDGRKFTTELVAFNPTQKAYVRTIADNDGAFYTFTTKGWNGNSLTWVGTQDKSGETIGMKQEITKTGNGSFKAVYYTRKNNNWEKILTEHLEKIPSR